MMFPVLALLKAVFRELRSIARYQECRKALWLLAAATTVLVANLIIVHETDSTALSAFTSLTIFDVLFLLSALLSAWAARQEKGLTYSYGYSRFEVLAVFTCTMLAQLNSFFIVKESVEHMFESDEGEHAPHSASTGSTRHSPASRQPLVVSIGALLIALCHYACIYLVRHPAFDHVTRWCSSSWIQEQVAEISHSICRVVPFLSVFLLPRLNPLSLIASVGLIMLMLTKLMIEVYDYHVADTGAAITFAALLIYTWLPMTKFTGRILLQSSPPHLLTQRDKIINEIGTLDGVLEVKDDKLWSCGFNSLVVTVRVRVRRDANEQMVLAHIHDKLSILATEATVQLVKDIDWSNAPRQFHWQHDSHMHDDHGHSHSHEHGEHGHSHEHHDAGVKNDDFVVVDFDRSGGLQPQYHNASLHAGHEHSHERGHQHDHSQPTQTNSYQFAPVSVNQAYGAGLSDLSKFYGPPSSTSATGASIYAVTANIPAAASFPVPPGANSNKRYTEASPYGDTVVSNRIGTVNTAPVGSLLSQPNAGAEAALDSTLGLGSYYQKRD